LSDSSRGRYATLALSQACSAMVSVSVTSPAFIVVHSFQAMMYHAAVIDCLQYCNYSVEIFRDLRAGGVDAIHTTISYHEDFRETVDNIGRWNQWFETYPDLIFPGRTAEDMRRAQAEGRTAVFFGLQNCSPIEDDIGLVEVLHALGVCFMQLSYNNQSLLATGCYEANDPGITRMGRLCRKSWYCSRGGISHDLLGSENLELFGD
jgi:microsomal dipeptidase-like Zn-dependent dipeptidase